MSYLLGGLANGLGQGLIAHQKQQNDRQVTAQAQADRLSTIDYQVQTAMKLDAAKAKRADQRAALVARAQQGQRNAGMQLIESGDFTDAEKQAARGNDEVFKSLLTRTTSPQAGPKRGLSPVYGQDADGNTVILQMNSAGGADLATVPEGVQITNPTRAIDTGTGTVLVDNRTGREVTRVDKDIAGKERETLKGKSEGEAQTQLPGAGAKVQDTIRLVDELLAHPSLDDAVGPIDGRTPAFRAGPTDFKARVEQLQNSGFLSARQELKGGGAITDFEGKKAESALNRASLAMSEADFKIAMTEFKEAMQRGYDALRTQAGRSGEAVPDVSSDQSTSGPTLEQLLEKY